MYDINALDEASSVQNAVALRLAHPAAKIIAGLGDGQRLGTGAEGAVCSFLAALLRCAGEEEDQ